MVRTVMFKGSVRGGSPKDVSVVRLVLLVVALLAASCSSIDGPDDGAELAAGSFTLEGHTDTVHRLLLLDDRHLVSGGYDGVIRVWDLTEPGARVELPGDETDVQDIALLADGRIATANFDEVVRVWDMAKPSEPFVYSGHDWVVASVVQLSDGRIASTGPAGVHVWSPEESGPEPVILDVANGAAELMVLESENLAVAGFGSGISIWDERDLAGQPDAFLETVGPVGEMLEMADGRIVATTNVGVVQVVDPADEAAPFLVFDTGVEGWVRALAQLPDGRLSFAADNGTVVVWDTAKGSGSDAGVTFSAENSGPVWDSVVIDGSHLATASNDRVVRIWDIADPDALPLVYSGHSETVRSLVLLGDGRIASAGQDRVIRIWDPAAL